MAIAQNDAGLCRNCWTWNFAGELACKRCSQPLAFVPEEVAELLAEEKAERAAVKQRIVKLLPFVLPVVLLLGGFGAFRAKDALARALGPMPGYDVPAGFRVNLVQPFTRRALRFDPCTKQHYVINPNGAPDGAIQDVHEAVRRVENATGIDFVYDGKTAEPGHWERGLVDQKRYGRRWAPLLVAWIPSDPLFFSSDYTYGAALPAWAENSKGELVFVGGTVLLNGSRQQRSGFGSGWTWGNVLMHEFGHIIGLDHVEDEQEIMNTRLHPDDGKWGEGDLAGLKALGKAGGCMEQPKVEDYLAAGGDEANR